MKKLFNPNGDDAEKRLFGGNITNILDMSNIKYPEFIEYVNVAYSNNWLPQKVKDFANDRKQYFNVLSVEEIEAYDTIISFLIFLDSIQTNNLPNISNFITLPEVVFWLARQTWDEALHSRSYGYTLDNVVQDPEKIQEITYRWKTNKVLYDRINIITDFYEKSLAEDSFKNFVVMLVANYLLEGLYFYNGFQFFHNLASRGLMISTDAEIRYIQRDENVHCSAFKRMIQISMDEDKELWTPEIKDMVKDMFNVAVKWEKKFSIDTLGDKILGFREETIIDYTHYLANKRLKDIGFEQDFPEVKINPYLHLEKIAAVDSEDSNRSNQFEVSSMTYKSPEILDGWDEI